MSGMIKARCRTAAAIATFFVLLTLLVGVASAHHSFTAEYDQNKPIKFTGKVTEMVWGNPHASIKVDVTTDGKTVNWSCETGAANALIRNGWRREDLKYGTIVNVDGWQARNGAPAVNVRTITFQDGRRLFAGTSNTAAGQQ